jgi:hypothetical protein
VEGAASEVEDEELDGEVGGAAEARREKLRVEGLRRAPRRGRVDEPLERGSESGGGAEVARDARWEGASVRLGVDSVTLLHFGRYHFPIQVEIFLVRFENRDS